MLNVQQLIPLFLAVASYFNSYFIGLFDQADQLSLLFLTVTIAQFYLFWWMFPQIQRFVAYLTENHCQLALASKYPLLLLIVGYLGSAIIISVSINLLLKLYFIVILNNAPVINWVHFAVYSLLGLINGGMILVIQLYLQSQVHFHQQQMQLAIIAQENERAQLVLLQAQIDPHFLFNNLNTLYSLIHQDSKTASEYLLHLSGYLRRSFEQVATPLISLTKELKELEHYLEILKIRFVDCIHIVISEQCQDLRSQIPPLSLAELIENAVKHNKIDVKSPLLVTISIFSDRVEIKNNRNKKQVHNSNGVGLDNLNKRIRLLTRKSLVITETSEEFIVKVPLINKEYSKVINYD
jgi:two-component system LytT family sensor kinase